MDTYGVQYVICNDNMLPLRDAIITQSASKQVSWQPRERRAHLGFEKYHPRTDVGTAIQVKEGLE